jgi:DHA3 family macrolide efflux protein-like MFS transporter
MTASAPSTGIGRGFLIVWIGQLVSSTGSAVSGFSLGIWAFQKTESVLSYSLAVIFATLPHVLLLQWVGRLLDRTDARRVMLYAEMASGLCAATLTMAVLSGRLEVWHTYIFNGIGAVCLVFQSVAYQILVAEMVPKGKLPRANGVIEIGAGISQLAAPVAGGALMAAMGLVSVAALDMLSFCVAIATLLLVEEGTRKVPKRTPSGKVPDEVKEQGFFASNPSMAVMMGYFIIQSFMISMVMILVTPIVLTEHSSLVLGSLVTFGGLGLILGGLLMSVLPSRRLVLLVLSVDCVQGAIMAFAGWTTNLPLLYLAAFLIMACGSLINCADQTLWQRKVPASQRGSVFALNSALMAGTGSLAALLAGFFSDKLFTPWLMPGGALADSVGTWFGVGPGRGPGLLVSVLGVLCNAIAVAALLSRRVRQIDRLVPDAE